MEINNESLGQTAEKVICDISRINASALIGRSIPQIEKAIRPILEQACKRLPRIIRHHGLDSGGRGGQSKSVIDFSCETGETISVKTTRNSYKICPSECGQPGADTFDEYFRHLYDDPDDRISHQKFKALCLAKSHEMMPIYLEHVFDCDYLLWLYFCKKDRGFKIIKRSDVSFLGWNKDEFSFTKDINSWNESCTVKYNSITLGEYQVHRHRNSYKFRFNMRNLCELLGL